MARMGDHRCPPKREIYGPIAEPENLIRCLTFERRGTRIILTLLLGTFHHQTRNTKSILKANSFNTLQNLRFSSRNEVACSEFQGHVHEWDVDLYPPSPFVQQVRRSSLSSLVEPHAGRTCHYVQVSLSRDSNKQVFVFENKTTTLRMVT